MGRIGQVAAALALLAGSAGAEEIHRGPAGDVVIYDTPPRLMIVGNVTLGPEEVQSLVEFQGLRDYYGALVVDPSEGDYAYWTSGYQSPEVALEVAYRSCLAEVGPGRTCVLFARVDPEGWRPRLGNVITLGGPASESFRGFYQGGLDLGFAAFAASAVSSGTAIGSDSQAAAETAALDECENSTRDALTQMTTAGRTVARQNGRHICRIISVHVPNQ